MALELPSLRRALWEELDRLDKNSVLLWEELSDRCETNRQAWLDLLKVALCLPTPGSRLTRSRSDPGIHGIRGIHGIHPGTSPACTGQRER